MCEVCLLTSAGRAPKSVRPVRVDFVSTRASPTARQAMEAQCEEIEEEETLSLIDKELELIKKALERNNGKRKAAADELGISERTLYRKIKQFDIDL